MIFSFGHVYTEINLNVPTINQNFGYTKALQTKIFAGGRAYNQAIAAARMGAKVSLIAAVGNDLFGKNIIHNLQREGVASSGVVRDFSDTGILTRVRDQNGKNINIISAGANNQLKTLQIPLMAFNSKATLILQDDVPEVDNLSLLKRAKDNGTFTIVNLHSPSQFQTIFDYADFIIINGNLDIPESQNIIRFLPQNTYDFDIFFAEDCFCGSFAACIQTGMDINMSYNYAYTMACIAGKQSMSEQRFPYLDDVKNALSANKISTYY